MEWLVDKLLNAVVPRLVYRAVRLVFRVGASEEGDAAHPLVLLLHREGLDTQRSWELALALGDVVEEALNHERCRCIQEGREHDLAVLPSEVAIRFTDSREEFGRIPF